MSVWLYQAQGISPYENIVFGIFVLGFAVRVTIYWVRIQQAQNKEDYSEATADVNKPGGGFLFLLVLFLVFAIPPNLQEKKDGSKRIFVTARLALVMVYVKQEASWPLLPGVALRLLDCSLVKN